MADRQVSTWRCDLAVIRPLDGDQAMAQRVAREVGGAVQIELAQYISPVGFDGCDRDAHLGRNLRAAMPFGDEPQDLGFPPPQNRCVRRVGIRPVLVPEPHHRAGDLRRQVALAVRDRAQRLDELATGGGLHDIARRARLDQGAHELPVRVAAERYNLQVRIAMVQLTGDLLAVHLRHRDVEYQDVGLQFLDPGQAFLAIGRLAYQFKFGRAAQQLPDGLPDQRMIVGQHNARRLHGLCSGTSMVATVPRPRSVSSVNRPPRNVIRSRSAASPRPMGANGGSPPGTKTGPWAPNLRGIFPAPPPEGTLAASTRAWRAPLINI